MPPTILAVLQSMHSEMRAAAQAADRCEEARRVSDARLCGEIRALRGEMYALQAQMANFRTQEFKETGNCNTTARPSSAEKSSMLTAEQKQRAQENHRAALARINARKAASSAPATATATSKTSTTAHTNTATFQPASLMVAQLPVTAPGPHDCVSAVTYKASKPMMPTSKPSITDTEGRLSAAREATEQRRASRSAGIRQVPPELAEALADAQGITASNLMVPPMHSSDKSQQPFKLCARIALSGLQSLTTAPPVTSNISSYGVDYTAAR